MGSTTKGPYDPTSTTPVDTLLGNSTSGCILIHNLSQYELVVSTPDNLMQSFVAAWGWRRFDVSDPMPFVQWSIAATPAQSNPPLSAVFVESYELRENAPPQYFGQYQRQTSIGGGQVGTNVAYQLSNADNAHFFDAELETSPFLALRLVPHANSGAYGIILCTQGVALNPIDRLAIDESSGDITIYDRIASLDGEPAATGALGVPVVDGLTQAQHVTATTAQTILSFTPTVTGTYRISGYLFLNNGTSGNVLTARFSFNDPDGGGARTFFMRSDNGSSNQALNGANSFANGAYSLAPYTFRHTGGQAITVVYTDPTNTPSDFFTVFVERVA